MDKNTVEQYHLHKEQPNKLQFEIHSLEKYLEKNIKHSSIPHSHSFYQILWFFNEGGKHFVDFNAYEVKKNAVFFISKDQIHYFDNNADYKGILIHFNESFLMQSDVDIFMKYNIFNNNETPYCLIADELPNLTKTYINLIKKELEDQDDFGHKQIIRYLLKSLLILLERTKENNTSIKTELNNQYNIQYLRFRELVENNYYLNKPIDFYAQELFVSKKTLTTITKSVVAKTPALIINDRIILESKRLLSFTPLKINEIAYKLGFEDASYFVKFFKRHILNSPSDYRKKLKK